MDEPAPTAAQAQQATNASTIAPSSSSHALGPVAAADRILTMDVLRGFAIFGIFMVNIGFFAMPLDRVLNPASLADASQADRIVHAIVRTLFEYKFVTLFSLLFGAGLAMQSMRAAARAVSFIPVYLRRTLILMFVGLCHGLLLWYGDILFIYSWTALLVMWFHKARPQTLLVAATVLIVVSLAFTAASNVAAVLFVGDSAAPPAATQIEQATIAATAPAATQAATSPATAPSFDGFLESLRNLEGGPGHPSWDAMEIRAYKEGPFLAAAVVRAVMFGAMLGFTIFGGFGFRVVGTFLLGMAMMKLGFFSPQRRRWHARAAAIGLGIGLPGELLVAWIYHSVNYELRWPSAAAEVLHAAASVALCIGYIGVWALIVDAGAMLWLTRGLAAVGRMALTNYLSQTVIATFLMYWWGLGWFNDVPRPQQVLIVVSVYLAQMIVSLLWLRAFTMGPLEWLWRSLTYWKLQPLRTRLSAA